VATASNDLRSTMPLSPPHRAIISIPHAGTITGKLRIVPIMVVYTGRSEEWGLLGTRDGSRSFVRAVVRRYAADRSCLSVINVIGGRQITRAAPNFAEK
jgi:hypothetical protein